MSEPLEARVRALADTWRSQQMAYPTSDAGRTASAAVRLCADEILALLDEPEAASDEVVNAALLAADDRIGEMVSSGDWEGQYSMGFVSTVSQVILEGMTDTLSTAPGVESVDCYDGEHRSCRESGCSCFCHKELLLLTCRACGWKPGQFGDTWAYVVTDGPKMLRETLSVAQNSVGRDQSTSTRCDEHVARLGRLIDECERHRPTDNACKHGNLHTPTCGCEDKPSALDTPASMGGER